MLVDPCLMYFLNIFAYFASFVFILMEQGVRMFVHCSLVATHNTTLFFIATKIINKKTQDPTLILGLIILKVDMFSHNILMVKKILKQDACKNRVRKARGMQLQPAVSTLSLFWCQNCSFLFRENLSSLS